MNLHAGPLAAVRRRVRPSSIDELTGLGNRRQLREDLRTTVAAANDDCTAMLVLLTLSGFKAYDSRMGHSAGDALLTLLGGRLRQTVRSHGAAYRIGGVEFAVLSRVGPGVGSDGVDALIFTASAALTDGSVDAPVTAWHGAVRIPGETREPGEALHIAGQRLLAAKTYAPPLVRDRPARPQRVVQLP